ncbi:tetraspanin-9-like isoform X1 [Arapaima gigas]
MQAQDFSPGFSHDSRVPGTHEKNGTLPLLLAPKRPDPRQQRKVHGSGNPPVAGRSRRKSRPLDESFAEKSDGKRAESLRRRAILQENSVGTLRGLPGQHEKREGRPTAVRALSRRPRGSSTCCLAAKVNVEPERLRSQRGMEKSSSEESAIHRSPSLASRNSDFARASTSGHPLGGRGFTAGAFYGSTGPRARGDGAASAAAGDKGDSKSSVPKGSKYVVFYLDLSFVFLLEFKKCNMARGCLCCLKYLMFLFNLIFWLCGCGLLGVGIWLSVSQGSFATFSPSFPSLSAANLVIAIGAVVMVTGFLGCLGAIKENKCLLLSFFIVLLIILLAELILLILLFVYTEKIKENAKKDLKDGLALYNTENNIGLRNAWNIIQAEWKCCGVTGYTDWHEALKEKVVPDRCCQEHYQECGRNATNQFWNQGCYALVETWLDNNKHLLGTIGMCILVVQLLGMAFSMTLFQQIHRTGKKYDA